MLKTILKPFASLTLTVILLGFSLVLVYAGTLAQIDMDVWGVQHKYFHTLFTWMPLQDLVPRFADIPRANWISIPFPGGYLIGSLLLLNLLAAHATRFKFSMQDLWLLPQGLIIGTAVYFWQTNHNDLLLLTALAIGALFLVTLFLVHNKRAGVIVIHLGLIILLIGEGITSGAADESQMAIDEGTYGIYSVDSRHAELAVVDKSNPDHDRHVVVSPELLKSGKPIDDARLPFEIKVDQYFPNSDLVEPKPDSKSPTITTAKGVFTAQARQNVSGVDVGGNVDYPSAFVTLRHNGKDLGSYLLTTFFRRNTPIEIGGKSYEVSLRFKREYKPYTIVLNKFSHDLYPGTTMARNFSSDVTLIDPSQNERRDVRISMNHPLRYRGETIYQADWNHETDRGTVLQIVRNPAASMPYIAIMIALLGLVVHFGVALVNFLSRRDLSGVEMALSLVVLLAVLMLGAGAYVTGGLIGVGIMVFGICAAAVIVFLVRNSGRDSSAPKNAPAQISGNAKGRRNLEDGRYELAPQSRFFSANFMVPAAAILFCLVYVIAHAMPHPTSKAYDLETFGRLPLLYEGRAQPFDSLARNALKILRGQESALQVEEKDHDKIETKVKPVPWLLDVLSNRKIARDYKIFSIDHPDLKNLFGLSEKEKYFSANDLAIPEEDIRSPDDISPKFRSFAKQELKAEDQERDRERGLSDYQHALLQLGQRIMLYRRLVAYYDTLQVIPPATGKDWINLSQLGQMARDTGQSDKYGRALVRAISAYGAQNADEFNSQVAQAERISDQRVPDSATKTAFEEWFNHFDPFMLAMVFYIGVFLFAAISWMGFSKPMSRASLWILGLALLVHSFGLIARIYISGRPPVTNLASASIFVGWGIVVLAMGLELIYRNGIGAVLAAVAGFPTLVIAQRLSLDGDTMKVLQAVLDTNIWLATHVVCITLGYAATFLAGLIGCAYVIIGVFTPKLDNDLKKTMARMMYGIICFALLLSFVGTILGGIWADQSWGRFWGWDPKENGAIMIVLANAIFLHARWGGIVRERGMASLAIFGNIITAWSFFGTNRLGVGLHSYGFMASAVTNLMLFIGSQVALILFCWLVPIDSWRSSGKELQAVILENEGGSRPSKRS